MSEKKNGMWTDMLKTLSVASDEGVALYIDEHEATPHEIIHTHCVNEESVYMPDYVLDERGELVEIRYHKVDSF